MRPTGAFLIALGARAAAQISQRPFSSDGNPILSDGTIYSADPGPIVVNDQLYILSGQDSAPRHDNEFIINNWNLFSTSTASPAGGDWNVRTNFLRPSEIFSWAAEGFAYASQIVQGVDGRFYLYAPVQQANTSDADPFAIGVAVASEITGPYRDAHPSGPIVSQSFPAPGNDIQNIDPTVLVDEDQRVYFYWGTAGILKGVELEADMTTFKGDIVDVQTLNGFFEAAWILKRKNIYYMLYADNEVGPHSECTPTSYHACIAYGTAHSALGPWTYRGVILGLVSSTTSHPGAVEWRDQWYLVYHNADARNGGNFRRSIAFDKMDFDDTVSPPTIQFVQQTFRPQPPPPPTRNRAPLAQAKSDPICGVQYWIAALNDEKINPYPLPPEYWSSFNYEDGRKHMTLTYTWESPQTLNGTAMSFYADQDAGALVGVPPPTSWFVEFLDDEDGWTAVCNLTAYPLKAGIQAVEVQFEEITTTKLRAHLTASTNGTVTAGVGVAEWYAFAPTFE